MNRLLTYLFVFFWSSVLLAQELDEKVSESQLMIGQPITLTYSVKINVDDTVIFIPKKDLIEALEVKEGSSLTSEGIEFEIIDEFQDTFIMHNQQKEWVGQYVITAWDSGAYILPGPSIVVNDSTFTFDDLVLMCHLSDPIDGVDLYDIKENYAEVPPRPFSFKAFLKTHWWWMTLIILGTVAFFVIRNIRRKRAALDEIIEDERPISLKERTLIAIDALEEAKLWEKDQLKEHFIELSYILRSYLTSRYDISLLEKTTHEASLILTRKGLEKETVDIILKILSQSDMVKFAKSKPEVIAILRVSTLARQVVAETSPLDFDNVD